MYKYYIFGRKVVCVSSYAGKTIKGIAKCDPNDQWDEDLGRRLARLRCDIKVAKRRAANASEKKAEALRLMRKAIDHVLKMEEYEADSAKELSNLTEQLIAFENRMK